MQNQLFQKLFLTLLTVAAFISFSGAVKAQRKVTTKPTTQTETLVSETANPAMSGAWNSGQLPQPLAIPAGNADEAIAVLAQKVAAKNEESIPALLTALQLSGFFVTKQDGSVLLAPADNKGQGLTINGWEVASSAKMFGDGKKTSLNELNQVLKSIPELKNAEPANLIMQGIRANAENTQNKYLRAWARFILELGKQTQTKNETQNEIRAETGETITAIQHLLIFRRFYGDLHVRALQYRMQANGFSSTEQNYRTQNSPRFYGASFSSLDETVFSSETENIQPNDTADQKNIPCKMEGNAPTVMDASATIIGYGYGELMSYLEDVYQNTPTGNALEKASKFQAIANIILAYAKFIQTYAALEVKLSLDDAPPLVRTKNAAPGERKNMSAAVKMNIGNWQMYNCIRTAINVTAGIDFATVNDGPIGDVGVTWHLDKGGAKDEYSNSTGINPNGEQIVGFTKGGTRIQETGASTLNTSSVNYGKTDSNGVSKIIIEGSPQKNTKTYRARPVMKSAVVRTTIKLKAGEIKGDMVDVSGQALGGAAGLISMPTELLYRISWASSGTLTVPVKDWEDCTGGWSGTITAVTKYKEETPIAPSGNLREAVKTKSWTLDAKYQLNGEQDRSGGFENGYVGEVQVNYEESDYARNFYEKFATSCLGRIIYSSQTQIFERKANAEGSGRVTVFVTASGKRGILTFNTVRAVGEQTWSRVYKTGCAAYDQTNSKNEKDDTPFVYDARGFSFGFDIDPKNPDVLSGSLTIPNEELNAETTYTWNLTYCR